MRLKTNGLCGSYLTTVTLQNAGEHLAGLINPEHSNVICRELKWMEYDN